MVLLYYPAHHSPTLFASCASSTTMFPPLSLSLSFFALSLALYRSISLSFSLYMYICVSIHFCLSLCMHIYIHIYIYISVHLCLCVSLCISWPPLHVCVQCNAHMYVGMCVCVCVCVCVAVKTVRMFFVWAPLSDSSTGIGVEQGGHERNDGMDFRPRLQLSGEASRALRAQATDQRGGHHSDIGEGEQDFVRATHCCGGIHYQRCAVFLLLTHR
jgi:hypothetical protein